LNAVHLGLKYGNDPRWFYNLSGSDRSSILAYERIMQPKPQKKPKRDKVSVTTGAAQDFWLGNG